MKQVIRRGLKEIIVDEVPDPSLLPHHVLVRPLYSLISSGTETASIHRDSLLKEAAENLKNDKQQGAHGHGATQAVAVAQPAGRRPKDPREDPLQR